MKQFTYTSSLILLVVLLSAWGSKGHRKISTEFVAALPAEMDFFKPSWTTFVANHASDADYRKSVDPNESARHYIDIDDYPEFIANGFISQSYDSLIAQHGFPFVWEHGTLPWATITTYDSLKSCFERKDWARSEYFAADLGHYVADGHMPLHITRNYNGQYTGQSGVHSRYESSMISRYESSLVYTPDPAEYIGDVRDFVFNYLYINNKYVDSILAGDLYARQIAGSTSGDIYYQALWEKTGNFTINLMRNASFSLASLIYTAWTEAGSPPMYPNAINEPEMPGQPYLLPAFPNPANEIVNFPVVIQKHPALFTIEIYSAGGKYVDTMIRSSAATGTHIVQWNVSSVPSGTYICLLKSALGVKSMKINVVH